MLGIADYFWRLVPGNPILRRVVESASKKRRDLFIRCAYLGLLVCIVLYSLFGNENSDDLAALAKHSTLLFQQMSMLQLGLVALLSPIFTAGAITQEKDSQTYDILLATPLTNGQIVLGSLLSRVFFVVALLISGIPIFAVTQIFGGVAIQSIVYSFLIAASTALVTGAMAMAIATFKVGTRRTIFSFYLFIVIYLVGGWLLDGVKAFHLSFIDNAGNFYTTQTSWFTSINPFLAMKAIFKGNDYLPPNLADLPAHYQGFPFGWMWTNPATFYCSLMFFVSFAMIFPSIIMLRRLAQSTTTAHGFLMGLLHLGRSGTRKPRGVWNNPIAWREARTKASAARASVVRYGFIFAGIIGAIVLLVMHSTEGVSRKYIHDGYDFAAGTLEVDGADMQKYKVTDSAIVKISGRDGTLPDLAGKWDVKNIDQDASGAITEIDLEEFPRELSSPDARKWLLGMISVEFSVILLIITNAAASTVTREKEDGTLDLLLSTPITSRYYIWGKLRGLVSFVAPLVAVPTLSAFIFIAHDLFRWLAAKDASFDWIVFPEALISMPAMLLIVCALAAILGMSMSLRCRTTVRAVMASLAIMVGVCGAGYGCGYGVLNSRSIGIGIAGPTFGAFSPFTLLSLLIDPYDSSGSGSSFDPVGANFDPASARIAMFIAAVIAIAAYTFIVWSMYKSMVKNFDMTIRKQSR